MYNTGKGWNRFSHSVGEGDCCLPQHCMLNCAFLQASRLSKMHQGPATQGSGLNMRTARYVSTGHICAGRNHIAVGILLKLCVHLSRRTERAKTGHDCAPEPDMAPLAALLLSCFSTQACCAKQTQRAAETSPMLR